MVVVGIVGVFSSLGYLAVTSKSTGPTGTDLVIAGLFGIASSLLALAIVAPVTPAIAGGVMVGAVIAPYESAFAIRYGPQAIQKMMEGKAAEVASDLARLAASGASSSLNALSSWCSLAIRSPQMQSASQAVTQAFVSLQKMASSPYGGFFNPNWID
jgi:hypothetical protein